MMTSRPRVTAAVAVLGALCGTLMATAPAQAHPHVWVTTEATFVYDKGTLVGIQHKWTFDDMYTAMAIQGLDTNNDGVYDRKELGELAQVNIDGLKEFDYFTFPKLGSQPLKLQQPKEYHLEYADGQLSLHMTTPLESPVLAEAEGFNVSIYDPSFFIAFDLAKTNPIRLSQGAPAGCQFNVGVPPEDAELAKKLADALKVDATGSVGTDLGGAVAKSITLSCPKS